MNRKHAIASPHTLSFLIVITCSLISTIFVGGAAAQIAGGCFQLQSNGPNSGGYEQLTSDICAGKPTYPNSGLAAPDQNCYVETTAPDGSAAWVTKDCSSIQQTGITNPGAVVNGQAAPAANSSGAPAGTPITTNDYQGPHVCGLPPDKQVHISIDIGCVGEKCAKNPSPAICSTSINPIVDALYAILRFLSAGVGLVIVVSIVIAGIQFTASRGDPNGTAKAIERIRSTVFALLLYLFAFALLNFLIPGGLFL